MNSSGESADDYDEVTDPQYGQWIATHFEVQPESGGLRLDGTCPRCRHTMTNWWFDELYRGRHSAHTPSITVEIPMVCTCATVHPAAPPGRSGCGAYWVVQAL